MEDPRKVKSEPAFSPPESPRTHAETAGLEEATEPPAQPAASSAASGVEPPPNAAIAAGLEQATTNMSTSWSLVNDTSTVASFQVVENETEET